MCTPVDDHGDVGDRGDLGGSGGTDFGKPCIECRFLITEEDFGGTVGADTRLRVAS